MGVNGKDDDVNQVRDNSGGISSDLDKIERSSKRSTQQIKHLKHRRGIAKSDINIGGLQEQYASQLAASPESELAEEDYVKLGRKQRAEGTKNLKSVRSQLRLAADTRRERLNEQTANSWARRYSESSVNGDIMSSMSNPNTQLRGTALVGKSWEELQAGHQGAMANISKLRDDNVIASQMFITPKGVNQKIKEKFSQDAGAMQGHIAQAGEFAVAMKQLKQRGDDPESRQLALNRMGSKARDIVHTSALEEQVRDGKSPYSGLSNSDLKKKEVEAAQKLVTTLNELNNSAGKTTKELKEMNSAAQEYSKELEDIQTVQGMGGGGGKSNAEKVSDWAGGIAKALQFAVTTGKALFVDQPMQNVQNIGGFANIENQKYDMYKKARAGNMEDQLLLGEWGGSEKFGQDMASRMQLVKLGEVGVGVAGGVSGGAKAWATGGMTGVDEAAGGASQAIIAGSDMYNHTTSGATQIQATLSAQAAKRAILSVTGQQLQTYRDYAVNLSDTGVSLGSGASAFSEKALSQDFMGQMHKQYLGPAEMARLSQMGASTMGSTFDASQVLEAKKMENRGLGSAQDVMGRMAALASAGSNNPRDGLGTITENAVAKGFDRAASIQKLVDNTASMAARDPGRAIGLDVSAAASKGIMSGLSGNEVNKEFAVQQAASTHEALQAMSSNVSTSLAGRINTARLSRQLGLSMPSAIGMGGQTADALRTVRDMSSEDDMRAALLRMGVSPDDVKGAKGVTGLRQLVGKGLSLKGLQQLEGLGRGLQTGSNKDLAMVEKWIGTDTNKIDEFATGHLKNEPIRIQRARARMAQTLQGTVSDQEKAIREGLFDHIGLQVPGNRAANGPGSTQENSRKLRGGEVTQQIEQAQAVANGAGGREVVDVLTKLYDETVKRAGSEKDMSKAAAESAKSFGNATMQFASASSTLMDAAKHLLTVGFTNQNNAGPPPPPTERTFHINPKTGAKQYDN